MLDAPLFHNWSVRFNYPGLAFHIHQLYQHETTRIQTTPLLLYLARASVFI